MIGSAVTAGRRPGLVFRCRIHRTSHLGFAPSHYSPPLTDCLSARPVQIKTVEGNGRYHFFAFAQRALRLTDLMRANQSIQFRLAEEFIVVDIQIFKDLGGKLVRSRTNTRKQAWTR